MKIDVLTLFPEMFQPIKMSILGRAIQNNIIEFNTINIRDFSADKHKKCDDTPFGGGAGMVMTAQPIYDAIKSVITENAKLIYMSPKGKVFKQEIAKNLSRESHLIILCGHYEGIDERIIEIFNPEIISIGDYVLTGGEIPAMAVIDSISRHIEGVLSTCSLNEESHTNNLLEYKQYTKPQIFMGLEVPKVLLSGNHAEIKKWRAENAISETKKFRPELLGGNNGKN